jgi:hypothetical protein
LFLSRVTNRFKFYVFIFFGKRGHFLVLLPSDKYDFFILRTAPGTNGRLKGADQSLAKVLHSRSILLALSSGLAFHLHWQGTSESRPVSCRLDDSKAIVSFLSAWQLDGFVSFCCP